MLSFFPFFLSVCACVCVCMWFCQWIYFALFYFSFSLSAWALVIFLIAFFPTKECRATHIDEMAGTTNKTKVGGQSADGGVSAWHTTNKFVNKCGIRWPTLLLCACVWVGVFIGWCVRKNTHNKLYPPPMSTDPVDGARVMMTVAH